MGKIMIKNERGFGLIEVLIALAVLGLIAAAFLGGLTASARAVIQANVRTTGESLARSQMEHVKNQDYFSTNVDWEYTVTSTGRSSSNPPSWWDAGSPGNPPLLDSSNYGLYSVKVIAESFDADEDGTVEVPGDDEDICKITVSVYREPDSANPVLILVDYKANR